MGGKIVRTISLPCKDRENEEMGETFLGYPVLRRKVGQGRGRGGGKKKVIVDPASPNWMEEGVTQNAGKHIRV